METLLALVNDPVVGSMLAGGVITGLTQIAKKYKINPIVAIGLLSIFLGQVMAGFKLYLPVEVQQSIVAYVGLASSFSIVIYQVLKKIIAKSK